MLMRRMHENSIFKLLIMVRIKMNYASLKRKGNTKTQLVMVLTVFLLLFAVVPVMFAQDTMVNLISESPLEHYAQGGIVVDGIAYFTSDDGGSVKTGRRSPAFHSIVAFDVKKMQKVRTYHFGQTYDSSPFLFQKKDGTWLIIAHEHQNQWTAARRLDTGEPEWTSASNQPGKMFFGYSSFQLKDGTQLILTASNNGLHAISGETGQEFWWIKQESSGGITPCVDQQNGWIFYQYDGKMFKIQAENGKILKSVPVESPNICVAWNTVLVNDVHGYYVATRWYGNPEWDCAIRVYDRDLNLVWERTGLPNGKKDTFTYAEGKLLTGSGNHWSKKYEFGSDEWKVLTAYSIRDGSVAWTCDLSHLAYESLPNIPYFNGYFYAEITGGKFGPSHLLRIRALDGKIVESLNYGRSIDSCAPCIIAHGRVLSGDLQEDRIVVTKIAENSNADWLGPFGNLQTNTFALPYEPDATLVPMVEIGRADKNLKK